ncbi:MAG: hypothetical protein IT300_03290 [Dehalococcoidia bacterium]|nr:hypothetical protein [Dehalococcoidia bacterium]
MRLPWRKPPDGPAFDPFAGEIPEYLELYPQWRPLQWRTLGSIAIGSVFASLAVPALDAYLHGGADPGSLFAVEAASLDVVCAEGEGFSSLRAFAPCDSSSRDLLALDPSKDYAVAFVVRIRSDGHIGGRHLYIVERACLWANASTLSPIDSCDVRRLGR